MFQLYGFQTVILTSSLKAHSEAGLGTKRKMGFEEEGGLLLKSDLKKVSQSAETPKVKYWRTGAENYFLISVFPKLV